MKTRERVLLGPFCAGYSRGLIPEHIAKIDCNVYVCNMDVAQTDPLVFAAASAIVPAGQHSNRLGLVVGLPGFGKTSLLTAAASAAARLLGGRVVWISGSVIASEQHLRSVLPSELFGTKGESVVQSSSYDNYPCIVAIDDLDALVFKRDGIADLLSDLFTRRSNLRLLASCHPSAARRFGAATGWLRRLADGINSSIDSVSIAPLGYESARSLIDRREPGLSDRTAERIIDAAGGHPAALVFLSRLAQLYDASARNGEAAPLRSNTRPTTPPTMRYEADDLVAWAGEFAGAVYAESWAALGPQQRAVLWQLARSNSPKSASEIATTIKLPASHVSAQVSRLVADGLVQRTGIRGQFRVAPLLASWIGRRATRDEIDMSSDPVISEPESRGRVQNRTSRRTRSNKQKHSVSADSTGAKSGRSDHQIQQPTAARKNGPPLR